MSHHGKQQNPVEAYIQIKIFYWTLRVNPANILNKYISGFIFCA